MKLSIWVITATLAVFGGLARYLQQLMQGEEFKWLHLFAHLFIGGFTGVSMAKIAMVFGLGADGAHLIAAWGGVVGLKGFEFVQLLLEKKIKQ